MHGFKTSELPPPPPGKTGWPWTADSSKLPATMADSSALPHFTIVTPSFNQGHFLEATIRSVLLQAYSNLEYIIIDGESTDESAEIIRKYEPWLAYWVSEKDKGQAHAINKGFALAKGEILGWLNSDDLLFPNAINTIAELYTKYPSKMAWVGGCQRINPLGRILSTVLPKRLDRDSIADWFHKGFFYQPSCFFAAHAWRQVGGLDENLHYAMDLDLWLKLSAIGEFQSMSEIIAAAIVHKDAKTQNQRTEMHAETAAVQIKHSYQDVAIKRLKRVLEQPSFRDRVWKLIKVDLKHFRLNFSFRKERQFLRYLQLPPNNGEHTR